MDRHEPMHSVYKEIDGEPQRLVLERLVVEAPVVVLDPPPTNVDLWASDQRIVAVVDGIAKRPYDLEREVFRSTLVVCGSNEHLLFVGVHHLSADGWSARQLMVEGVGFYREPTAGELPVISPPVPSYDHWTVGETARMDGKEGAGTRAFWANQLRGAPLESRIPTRRHYPQRSLAGARRAVRIPAGTRDALRTLAREERATIFTTLLAGLSALVARLSAQEDVVVAVPNANRVRGTQGTIGLFATTLPVRARLGPDMTFRELLRQVDTALKEARKHGWLPIDRILREAGSASSGRGDPLCQVMLNYLGRALPPIPLGELAFGYLGIFDTGESQYDLSIHLEDLVDGMRGYIEYRISVYDDLDAARVWDRLLLLLEAAATAPDCAICDLPILNESDRQELQALQAGAQIDYDLDTPLDECVARQVQRTPCSVALSDSMQNLTYHEMWTCVRRLAASLREHGVERGSTVAVCAERSVYLPMTLLAVMHAGAAYCPLDPEQPAQRLRHLVSQAEPSLMIVAPAFEALVREATPAEAEIELMVLDEETQLSALTGQLQTADAEFERPAYDREDVAYVIFTSGSTGRPKGVAVPHRGVLNRLYWMQEQFGLSSDDTVLQKTPYTFDVSVWEFFWPLIAGARLHLADPDGHRDPEYLSEVIREKSVTTIHFVPSMLATFLEEPTVGECRSLRRVICSGETLPGPLMNAGLRKMPGATIWNLYGPTEASIDVTCWQCEQQSPDAPVPIGRPIANVKCMVLDAWMRQVPVGTPGELYLGGVQLALGYVGQPELTAERFVADPAEEGGSGERLYRTGDLVRWRPDGLLDYLGRLDDQVKLRGIRIELGEIENVLRELPEIIDAAVTVRTDIGPAETLVAYVVPAGEGVDEIALRTQLSRALPEYMVPSRVVTLDELPLTASGKLDRKALPRPATAASRGRRLLTQEEALLASIWRDLLGITDSEQIGPTDSYFALGGDSMTSVRLRAAARKAGFELPLKDILSHPVLADMANALKVGTQDSDDRLAAVLPRPEVLPPGIEDAYPLTAMQAGMIFHSEFSETSSSYQVTFDLELRLPWAPDLFQETADALVARHEILRTSIDLHSAKQAMQLVHAECSLPVALRDLRGLQRSEQAEECDRLFDAEQVRRFDLSQPPMLRLTLVRTGKDVAHLFMAFHDAIFDGWSGATFLTELCTGFLAKLDDRNWSPATSTSTYRDFVALERAAGDSAESLKFWRKLLTGAPFARVPRRSAPGGMARSRDVSLEIANDVVERLRSLAEREKVQVKEILVAAYLAALGRTTGVTDVVGGIVSGGRPETEDADRMLGQFLNTVPVRTQLNTSWRALIGAVHHHEVESSPHRRVPLLTLARDRGGALPFETAFNLVHFHIYKQLQGEQRVGLLSARFTDPFHFPLTVNARIQPFDGSLTIVVNYNETEVEAEQARALGNDIADALAAIVEDVEGSCADWLQLTLDAAAPWGAEVSESQVSSAVVAIKKEGGASLGRYRDAKIERRLSEIWCQVLELDEPKLDEDFFILGGDSILSIQLTSRARAAGIRLRPRDVFECPTLGELIMRASADNAEREAPHPRSTQSLVMDAGLIALTSSACAGYDVSALVFRLSIRLDREAFLVGCDAVFKRHELLRTVAQLDGESRWMRHVGEAGDARSRALWDVGVALTPWLESLAGCVDATSGPAAVIGHLVDPESVPYLALVADHAVADLASLQLVVGDFLDAYAQQMANGDPSLDPAPGLAECESASLTMDERVPLSTPLPWRPQTSDLHGDERVQSFVLDRESTTNLLNAARKGGVDVAHLLVVAGARALLGARKKRESAADAMIVVDLMDAGRGTVGPHADLVAPLAHPVPLVVADPGSQALAAARSVAIAARARKGNGGRISEIIDAQTDTEAPALGVLVNHYGRVDVEVPWPLAEVVPATVPLRTGDRPASHAVELRSWLRGERLNVEVVSPMQAATAAQLSGFASEVNQALESILEEVRSRFADSGLSGEELKRLLDTVGSGA